MGESDPVRDLVAAFYAGTSMDELSDTYKIPRPWVEGMLRMSMSLNRRAMLRYTAGQA